MTIFRHLLQWLPFCIGFLFMMHCHSTFQRKDNSGIEIISQEEIEILSKIQDLQNSGIHSLSYMYLLGDGKIRSGQIGGKGKEEIQRFKIGSITKLFTGIAILQLKDAGKLKLDDTVSKWLPEINELEERDKKYRKISLRDLLTHQSGLPSDLAAGFFLPPSSTEEEVLSAFRDLPSQLKGVKRNEPGKVHSYSNLAFGLLGSVIERVSKSSIEDYFQKQILTKAGMKHTTLLERNEGSELVPGYQGIFWKTKTENPAIRDLTAGSLSTTGEDMGLFLRAFFRSKKGEGLLSKSSFEEFHRIQMGPRSNFEMKIGLPVILERFEAKGRPVWIAGHSGSLPPYFADLMYDPETESASFLAGNTLGLATGKIRPTNKEILKLTYKQKTGSALQSPSIPNREKQNEIRDFSGLYVSPLGIHELKKGDKPTLSLYDIDFDLVPKDNRHALELNLFFGLIPFKDPFLESLRVEWETWEGEKIFTLLSEEIPKGSLGIATQFQPDPYSPDSDFYGTYQSSDPYAIIPKIRLNRDKRGFSAITITYALGGMENQITLPCKLETPDQLRIHGYGRNLGEQLELSVKNGKQFVQYSGITFEKK
ncbi:class A beta-lactamase-related serine hydrolase [Leptospira ognonensis]|uniref:Class A beta-lactamase-related serine hydrolase n=1 Tax=Leptospira ognonensis TaxID=2484945 RepID=A0A4R9JWN2_9LEPT|nr:serine hydrolase domain-containing protein [Leptospira ognonensis]TGL56410.1 class A beta-lactamase-related serine hydrolase [Leptospira ognonensis]